jgi:hypothetical protein
MIQELTIPGRRNKLARENALERLRRFGIEGKRIYLIDLVPLIEMIWAGGRISSETIEFLYKYAKSHIRHINAMAGYLLIKSTDAANFSAPYLASPPNMSTLKQIRECIVPVRLGETPNDYGDMIMNRIMAGCREILSISVAKHPNELHLICSSKEMDKYLDIKRTFSTYDPDSSDAPEKSTFRRLEVELPQRRATHVGSIALS